ARPSRRPPAARRGRLAVAAGAVRHRVGEELFHEEGEAEAALARKSGGGAHLGEEGGDLRQGVSTSGEDPVVAGAAHWAIIGGHESCSGNARGGGGPPSGCPGGPGGAGRRAPPRLPGGARRRRARP